MIACPGDKSAPLSKNRVRIAHFREGALELRERWKLRTMDRKAGGGPTFPQKERTGKRFLQRFLKARQSLTTLTFLGQDTAAPQHQFDRDIAGQNESCAPVQGRSNSSG